jgi:hypothetical protein
MKKVRLLINLASLGALIIGLLPALSQAGTITLGDGSQYEVKLQSHLGNTWTYSVKELSGKSLSHWNVGIKACMDKGAVVSSSPTGDVKDGSTGFEGMKWDVSEGFTEGTFSITLNADYPETTILAQAKAGKRGNERTGEVKGPDCQAEAEVSQSSAVEDFVAPPTFFVPKPCDFIYGVHDDGLNNSQLLAIYDFEIDVLGSICAGCDIEAVDVSPKDELYVASSDETGKPGVLYKADMTTGQLTEIGSTGYAEVDGISFHPIDGTLWGWAQDVGLITIDIETGKGTQVGSTIEGEFEDLTWNNDGTILYVALNGHKAYNHIRPYLTGEATYKPDPENDATVPHIIIAYDMTKGSLTEVCSVETDDGEIEALEMLPDGKLMLGYHKSKGKPILAKVDPSTSDCVVIEEASPTYNITKEMHFGDIEALGACIVDGQGGGSSCPTQDTQWMYAKDSFTDGTGHKSLEIYGVAVKQEGNTIMVAINANMGPEGETDWSSLHKSIRNKIKDGNVAFSDFVLDFGGDVKYAVHFAAGNDSSVTTLGLYQDITLKDVAKENAGFSNLKSYQNYAKNPSLGDLSFSDGYFDVNSEWSVPMSIESGTQVNGDNFTSLTAADLAGMGLDFVSGLGVSNASELGSHTFGFSFTKTDDMVGDFTGYFFTECRNDGVAIVRALPDC